MACVGPWLSHHRDTPHQQTPRRRIIPHTRRKRRGGVCVCARAQMERPLRPTAGSACMKGLSRPLHRPVSPRRRPARSRQPEGTAPTSIKATATARADKRGGLSTANIRPARIHGDIIRHSRAVLAWLVRAVAKRHGQRHTDSWMPRCGGHSDTYPFLANGNLFIPRRGMGRGGAGGRGSGGWVGRDCGPDSESTPRVNQRVTEPSRPGASPESALNRVGPKQSQP